MGYDVELVQVPSPAGTRFPVPSDAAKRLLSKAVPFGDAAAVTRTLCGLEGAKPGLRGSVDYLGKGLSYARFTVGRDRVHVENNLNCAELLKVYGSLREIVPDLVILDLQSGQLHDAASFQEWWAKPL